ncbi:MAG: fumarate hydratase [Bacillus thermozeamaize]|uniref:Fumarate hydratase n=1 Tax=Bacillus thermozeamaize TaxID=230954 RepID=A0A1Y3PL60_9BACI|nr:MAG: fumarate hydratase [Bacillus thermozeamaize]
MREVHYDQIVETVARLCQEANYDLGADTVHALRHSLEQETSEVGRDILRQILLNAEIAADERVPMCQDTGFAVFIVELGQDCRITGGSLYDAINDGVRRGYKEGYLRFSMVEDPISRVNTGDNTPAIVHVELVAGDRLTIHMAAKGGGSENMSFLRMLAPAEGMEGVKRFVVEAVKEAGPNPCPPIVVGVGIGGNFERVAYLAKKALFRPLGQRHPRQDIAALEEELIRQINALGIGPQGMGGRTTALDVHVEIFATHIAALPVAVNINCHANRHKTAVL